MRSSTRTARKSKVLNPYAPSPVSTRAKGPPQTTLNQSHAEPVTSNAPASSLTQSRLQSSSAHQPQLSTNSVTRVEDMGDQRANSINFGLVESLIEKQPGSGAPSTAPPASVPNTPPTSTFTLRKPNKINVHALFQNLPLAATTTPTATHNDSEPNLTNPNPPTQLPRSPQISRSPLGPTPSAGQRPVESSRIGDATPLHHWQTPYPIQHTGSYYSHGGSQLPPPGWPAYYYPPQGYDPYMHWQYQQPHPHTEPVQPRTEPALPRPPANTRAPTPTPDPPSPKVAQKAHARTQPSAPLPSRGRRMPRLVPISIPNSSALTFGSQAPLSPSALIPLYTKLPSVGGHMKTEEREAFVAKEFKQAEGVATRVEETTADNAKSNEQLADGPKVDGAPPLYEPRPQHPDLARLEADIRPVPGIGTLVEHLKLIFKTIERGTMGTAAKSYPELEKIVKSLGDVFNEIIARAQHYNEMDQITEFLQFEEVSEDIKRLYVALDSCLALLSGITNVSQLDWIEGFIAAQAREHMNLNRIRQQFQNKRQGFKAGKLEQLGKKRTAQEMFQCLVKHGCQDLTGRIEADTISEWPVATGAYGDIWKGLLDDNTEIAIKVWSFRQAEGAPNKCLKGAMREIYNWSKVDHENIQKLLGVYMHSGRLGMVSKWMGNGDLRSYIQRYKPADRHQLCIEAAKAVQYLHMEGMVHGDLKACNFLVSSDGVVKLTDFDHSIISCHSVVFSQTTTMGGGTMRWMAPELVMDPGEVELRSTQADVYALGMTILEIMTGDVPYAECQNDQQVYCKLSEETLPERKEPFQDAGGEQLWELLLRCWDRDPALRPSADEVVDSLHSLIHTTAPSGSDTE